MAEALYATDLQDGLNLLVNVLQPDEQNLPNNALGHLNPSEVAKLLLETMDCALMERKSNLYPGAWVDRLP